MKGSVRMLIKKDTHTIIKKDDAEKYLTQQERASIGIFLGKIADGRVKNGKKPFNHYHVCNMDEPYAEEVLTLILQGEEENTEKDLKFTCPCYEIKRLN